jgi:hypothetical protein
MEAISSRVNRGISAPRISSRASTCPLASRMASCSFASSISLGGSSTTHQKQGIPLAPGMEIGYVVKDAKKWEVEPEKTAAVFDAGYYGKLLEEAWEEAAFVFSQNNP